MLLLYFHIALNMSLANDLGMTEMLVRACVFQI